MTNEKIVEALSQFNEPIGHKIMHKDELGELADFNYFIYREGSLKRGENDRCTLYQTVYVIHVSENKTNLMEKEIIKALEDTGLRFIDATYDETQKLKSEEWVDITTFEFSRPYGRI